MSKLTFDLTPDAEAMQQAAIVRTATVDKKYARVMLFFKDKDDSVIKLSVQECANRVQKQFNSARKSQIKLDNHEACMKLLSESGALGIANAPKKA